MASVIVSGLLLADRPLDETERGILAASPVWTFDLLTSVPVTALPAGRVYEGILSAGRVTDGVLSAGRVEEGVLSAGRIDP